MKLPSLAASQLDLHPLNWSGIPRAYRQRYLHRGEPEVLVALVRSVRAHAMIEIGVNEGRTARLMLDNVPTLRSYIGVDVLPGYVTECAVQRREVPRKPGHLAAVDARFRAVVSPNGSFDLQSTDLPQADVVFIDGDHGRKAVEHDSALARQLVRPGGLIIWHDYHDLGTVDVRDVLHDFADAGAKLTHVQNTWIVFERVGQ